MNKFVFDPTRKFLDPEQVLFAAGLGANQIFADFGSGSGFYTLAAAKIVGVQGIAYSIDILESTLDHIVAEARLKGLRNVSTLICDLEQTGSCSKIPSGSADMVLFANITHQISNKPNLFAEGYRLLKTGGKLLIIEWNEQPGPIGPPASERITESEAAGLARKSGFKTVGNLIVDPYHYGSIFIK